MPKWGFQKKKKDVSSPEVQTWHAITSVLPCSTQGTPAVSPPTSCVLCAPPVVAEPWLLLACQWEGFVPRLNAYNDWLWPANTVEDQLCRGLPHRTGLTSLEDWCLLSLPLEYGAVEVVGWCFNVVWSCLLCALVLEPPKVSHCLCSA